MHCLMFGCTGRYAGTAVDDSAALGRGVGASVHSWSTESAIGAAGAVQRCLYFGDAVAQAAMPTPDSTAYHTKWIYGRYEHLQFLKLLCCANKSIFIGNSASKTITSMKYQSCASYRYNKFWGYVLKCYLLQSAESLREAANDRPATMQAQAQDNAPMRIAFREYMRNYVRERAANSTDYDATRFTSAARFINMNR